MIRNLGRFALALIIAAVSTVDGAHLYAAESYVPSGTNDQNVPEVLGDGSLVDELPGNNDESASEGEQHVDLGAPPVFLVDQACKSPATTPTKFPIRSTAQAIVGLHVDHHLPFWRPLDAASPHDAPPSRLGTSPHLAHGPPAIILGWVRATVSV